MSSTVMQGPALEWCGYARKGSTREAQVFLEVKHDGSVAQTVLSIEAPVNGPR